MAEAVNTAVPAGAGSGPIGAEEFELLMFAAGVSAGLPLAVAVSGGGDSMALARLAADWCGRHGVSLMALTVDHVLRPGSGREALQVGEWLAEAGIRHVILQWDGVKPSRGIQAAAREARYRLMCDWAEENGTAQLLVAHNLEDQAETFLMRLRRGAGVYGLASMAPQIHRRGIAIHRPLLGISRTRLRQTLVTRSQPWIEDPSNENPAFERTRWRALVAALELWGFDAARLAGLAQCCAQIRSQMDVLSDAVLAGVCNRYGS
ncbi:MAG: tRNA lysidine(34) synthetase TilS, partial [Pseudomonadota bacterium]|nr:tRNA lysidine(34) synthetase TilS [Pseudomonadota bacterium]